MDRHLVSVEIGIVCGTYERMQLDRLTLYQDRLKCLNTKSMQCGGTVQHNRMLFDHFFENVPNFRLQSLDHFFAF